MKFTKLQKHFILDLEIKEVELDMDELDDEDQIRRYQ